MTRQQLLEFVQDEFSVLPDFPFDKDFETAVLRHKENKKWFALLMKVSKSKLNGDSDEKVDVLNIKCAPILKQPILQNKGFYTAYHMNKVHWISIILEETTLDDVVPYIEMSFDLTQK